MDLGTCIILLATLLKQLTAFSPIAVRRIQSLLFQRHGSSSTHWGGP